jgi:hypothetical protein
MMMAREVDLMRYFFDVIDKNGTTQDTDGVVLRSFDQVQREARRALTEIAAEEPFGDHELKLAVHVRDRNNREIYNICLHLQARAA